ncbi:MAG: hypothetical protein EB012_06430, partial [Gammaproteobacteria bacterium]|nr:hypothetical protein [Gammaproteobacteria bacterium]
MSFFRFKKPLWGGSSLGVGCRQGMGLLIGLIFTLAGLMGPEVAAARENPLPNGQAFHGAGRFEGGEVVIAFDVAEGYHLYKTRFKFTPDPKDIALGTAILPQGLLEADPEMGETEVYRAHVEIRVPVLT